MGHDKDNKNQDHFSVAVHYMHLLTDYAARHNLPMTALLERAGIQPEAYSSNNDRVPFTRFAHLCEMTAEALNEPAFGLKLGQSIRVGHLGSHGFALMSCATARELMLQSARYSVITIDAAHSAFEQQGNEFIRYWRSNLPEGASLGRLQNELNQANTITLARWLTNRDDLNPNWVSFQHARPDDIQAYEDIFRCPIRFNAAATAISFNPAYLDLPLPHGDTQLHRIMNDVCTQLLKQLGDTLEPAWLSLVRKAALESFRHGMPEIGPIAAAAGLRDDQLKERLAERGLSFRSLIEDLRKGLAVGYARDPNLSLVDIAYLLGFSEQSAFQRAFKRWTNTTPGNYRRLSLAEAG